MGKDFHTQQAGKVYPSANNRPEESTWGRINYHAQGAGKRFSVSDEGPCMSTPRVGPARLSRHVEAARASVYKSDVRNMCKCMQGRHVNTRTPARSHEQSSKDATPPTPQQWAQFKRSPNPHRMQGAWGSSNKQATSYNVPPLAYLVTHFHS